MSTLVLPNRTDLPEYDFSLELDGVTYTLNFRWNERDSAWYMDIEDAEEQPVLMGIKVVLNMPLGRRTRVTTRPPGTFIAVDTSGDNIDAGYTDLGGRVLLCYQEAT